MKTISLVTLVAAAVLLVPSFAQAATPRPVTEAYDALSAGHAYKMKLTSKNSMTLFGAKIVTDLKGSGYQDTYGNAEGKMTFTATFSDLDKKSSSKKVTFPMEYKYFPNEQAFYFKFGKLPKDASALKGARANTWYVQNGLDTSGLTGSSFMTDEIFSNLHFVEKGSSKKEYVYTFSADESEFKGTMRISKKTMLPSGMTLRLDMGAMKSDTTASYSFGGSKRVTKPKGALSSDAMKGLIGGTGL